MAKKQTTAGPSKSKRQSDDQPVQSTYLSRAEREARTQRWVMLAMGTLLGVILVVLLSGIVYELILYPNQAIASVDGENITVAEFQPRVRFERWSTGLQLLNIAQIYGPDMLTDSQSPFYQDYLALQPNQEYIMGRRVQDQMIDEIILQREAEARGITVSDDELETRIQEFFGYDPDGPDAMVEEPTEVPTEAPTPIVSPTPAPEPTATDVPEETPAPTVTPMPTVTPAPTLTADELLDRYETNSTSYFDEATEVSGLSEEDIRAFFSADILQSKLQDEFAAEVPTAEEQVDARHILVATEEEAQDVLAALADGEPFADLARAASTDTGSGANGGELGWASPSNYVTEFGDAVANAEIGAIVGPIETQFGFHIIQVNAREVRDLTEDEITQRASQAYSTWLQEQRDAADISYPVDYLDRTPNDPTIYELGLAISG